MARTGPRGGRSWIPTVRGGGAALPTAQPFIAVAELHIDPRAGRVGVEPDIGDQFGLLSAASLIQAQRRGRTPFRRLV